MSSPGGDEVARVSVRVVPDVSHFREDLRRELASLKDEDLTIQVKLDLDKADLEAQLQELRNTDITVPVDFKVEDARDDIARATKGAKVDPINVPLDLEEADFEAQIARVENEIRQLDGLEATPEVILKATDLREQLRTLKAELAAFSAQSYDIRIGADGITEVRAEAFNLKATLDALAVNPILVELALKDDDVRRKVAEDEALLASFDGKTVTAEVQLEIAQATARLAAFRQQLDAIDNKRLDILAKLDIDDAAAVAQLAFFRARQEANAINIPVHLDLPQGELALFNFARVASSIGDAISSGIGTGFSSAGKYASDFGNKLEDLAGPIGQIVSSLGLVASLTFAVQVAGAGLTAAYGTVATVISAIPATLGLIAAAAGVTALGLDGIKKAAAGIKPQFDALKASVSATFEKGLTPIFKNLATIFPKVTDSINNVASALVSTAFTVTQFITSSRGVATINTIFNNTAQAIRNMQPGIQDIISTFLTLASQAGVFDALTSAVNTFGAQFKKNVTDQLRDGTLSSAFAGLRGMLDQLAIGFSDLVKNGVTVFANAAPGVNRFIGSLTGFFDRFNWASLGKSVGGVFEGLAGALDKVDPQTIRDIEDAFKGVADTFNDPNFQGNLDKMIGGIGPVIRQLNELMQTFGDIGGAIADVIRWLDIADQKFHKFLDWFNQSNKSDNGKGILTSDAQWWQDLMDGWDGWIDKLHKKWDEFTAWFSSRGVPKTQHGAIGGGGGFDNPFGNLFNFKLPDLPDFGDIAAPGLAPGWDTLVADIQGKIDAMTAAAASAVGHLQSTVVAGMAAVRTAFDFTGIGASLGVAFLGIVGTVTLGMASIAATVTAGMAQVNAAFNFTSIGTSLGNVFLGLVGTTTLGMQSLAAVVTAGMVLVNASFNFAGVNATYGLLYQQMVGTTTLGMASVAAAIATGMVLVNASFNFANINLTLGLLFQQMIGTTTLGMASVAAAVTAGMALVNAAFNFANLNLLLGLMFQQMVGTTNLGMASIAAAVSAGMAAINAAITGGLGGIVGFWVSNWATMITIVAGAIAGVVGAVSGGMAAVLGAVTSALGAILGFWRTNWQTMITVVRTMMDSMGTAVRVGMDIVKGAVTGGIVGAVSAARAHIGDFRAVGTALMDGLKAGITAAAGAIASAAAAVVRGALAAARAAGIVKSPSKAMMEIGGYLGEGLAIGLEDSAPRVAAAADKLASAAVDTADKITAAFSGDSLGADLSAKVEHSFSDAASNVSTKDVVGQLRALNGNVDQSSYLSAIIALLQAIASQGQGGNAAMGAQTSRRYAELGAF